MLIIDSHLDLSWNALQWNRDLTQSTYTIRTREVGMPGRGRAKSTVALPEMRQGRVAVSFATLLARSTGSPEAHIDFNSPTQTFAIAHGQLAYYRALEKEQHIRILTDGPGLTSHIAEWEKWESSGDDLDQAPPLGLIISMEGADPVLNPYQLEEWWEAGLRLMGLVHYGSGRYAGGTGTESGLTGSGASLLREMERLGFLLDLTHCSDKAFWEAVSLYDGAVFASHQNCRALVPHQRQFSDEQLGLIIERDGVIGSAFDIWMLQPGFTRGDSNAAIAMEHVVDHIDHVCQLAGNSHHAAIGSDLDGGFGREQSPHDLDTIADLQQIPSLLARRGYSDGDIAAIMYGNWLRFLQNSWKL